MSAEYELDDILAEAPPLPKQNAGTCTVSASVTLNLDNFENVKINVGFSEGYTGVGSDTRDNKYIELAALVEEKFQDVLIQYAKTAKTVNKELHTYFKKKTNDPA